MRRRAKAATQAESQAAGHRGLRQRLGHWRRWRGGHFAAQQRPWQAAQPHLSTTGGSAGQNGRSRNKARVVGQRATADTTHAAHFTGRHGRLGSPWRGACAWGLGTGEGGLAGQAFRREAACKPATTHHALRKSGMRRLLLRGGRHVPCWGRCCGRRWRSPRRGRCGGSSRHRRPLWLRRHHGSGRRGGRRDRVPATGARPGDPCHVGRHGQSRAAVAALKLEGFRSHPMGVL